MLSGVEKDDGEDEDEEGLCCSCMAVIARSLFSNLY